MKSLSVTIQINTIEQYFPVVLFIMLCNVVLTFQSLDEILKCLATEQYFPMVLIITNIKNNLFQISVLLLPVAWRQSSVKKPDRTITTASNQ